MSVKAKLHPYLRKFTNGQAVVEVKGQTVGECIDDLEFRFPGIKGRLCDEKGSLLSVYDVCVNGHSSYPEALSASVKDGDELTIITIIAGG